MQISDVVPGDECETNYDIDLTDDLCSKDRSTAQSPARKVTMSGAASQSCALSGDDEANSQESDEEEQHLGPHTVQ